MMSFALEYGKPLSTTSLILKIVITFGIFFWVYHFICEINKFLWMHKIYIDRKNEIYTLLQEMCSQLNSRCTWSNKENETG